MIIDGRAIAEEIKEELRREIATLQKPLTLCVIMVGDHPVTERFVQIKKKFAKDIGVAIVEKRLPDTTTTDEIISVIEAAPEEGVVVQLPLSPLVNISAVLNAIPVSKDIDVLSEKSFKAFEEGTLSIVPPVMGAIKEILLRQSVFLGDKKVVIVGQGKLVGLPAALWFKRRGSKVVVCNKGDNIEEAVKDADIVVLGAGVPGLLKPEMVEPGVIILDAGAGESEGRVVGDADPRCAEKAAIFTPTPGGIGPITVAMLFKNLLAHLA